MSAERCVRWHPQGKEADWEAALAGKKGVPKSGFLRYGFVVARSRKKPLPSLNPAAATDLTTPSRLSVKRKKEAADEERAKKNKVEWPEEKKSDDMPAEGARKKKKKDRKERD